MGNTFVCDQKVKEPYHPWINKIKDGSYDIKLDVIILGRTHHVSVGNYSSFSDAERRINDIEYKLHVHNKTQALTEEARRIQKVKEFCEVLQIDLDKITYDI